MKNINLCQRGFSHHFALLFFLIIFAIAGMGYKVATNAASKSQPTNTYFMYSEGGKYKYVYVWGQGRCGTKTVLYATGSKSNALVFKMPPKDSSGKYEPIKLICTAGSKDSFSFDFKISPDETGSADVTNAGDGLESKCIYVHDTGISRSVARENGSCNTDSAKSAANAAKNKAIFHKLSGDKLAHAKKIASDFWGGNVCGKNGKNIKIVWYSSSSYFKILAQVKAPEFGDPNPQAQLETSHRALAYAFWQGAYLNDSFKHCKVFMNSSTINREYTLLANPRLNQNSAQFECTILVHEVGHLRGFYSSRPYIRDGDRDHHHSPDKTNIMYGGGTSSVIQSAHSGAPRCMSELR
jgi:hypothetical protein